MKSVPLRVLHILNNLGSGGAESMLMNLYRTIDKSKVQFDFMVRSTGDNRLVDEIERLGGHVYIMPDFPRKAVSNYLAVDAFFAEHKEYKIIHVHANALIYVFPLILAKKHGIPCRILHSHNTNTMWGWIGRLIHKINVHLVAPLVTDRLACSDDAGKWMFGKKEYKLLNNGIDIENNSFSEISRQRIRQRLGIEGRFIIGHVGRISPQKNHSFIVDVFIEVEKKHPDSILLLIGEGQLPPSVQERLRRACLLNKVIMTGVVSDVPAYMSAMDAFLFPSLYEGLGMVVIEAQANGLPCYISDRIPRSAVLTPLVHVLSLDDAVSRWAESILNCTSSRRESKIPTQLDCYDIRTTAQQLTDFYYTKVSS